MTRESLQSGLLFLALFCAAGSTLAQRKDKTQSTRTGVYTPEQELAGFKVAPGFVIELVASERDSIINPVDLTFDDAGRLWTQTARMYPLDPIADIQWEELLRLMDDQNAQKNHPNFKRILELYQGKRKGTDKIIVLSDLYGKTPVKSSVWADGLTIPMSILPYKNGVFVAQGSEMFFLDDANHDSKADNRLPLLTGFGFTDTHTMAHTLVRAPGGWVHFSHGGLNKGEVTSLTGNGKAKIDFSKIGRFSFDGKKVEVVSSGLNNIWGFQLRHNGQWYGSEANDLGYSVVQLEPGVGFPGIGNDRIRPYQPFMPPLHEFRVGGTGISGTAFADDASGSFPDEYKDVAFLANPITSSINAVKMVRNEDGTVTSSHLPDLLTSEDDWFRPVNMEFGPDGCLYIADWYNKIVSHNELPTTHPDRDKTHGRIWRIRHVSQKPRTVPDFYEVKTDDLPRYLTSPSLWEKRAAWHQISDRPATETSRLVPQLIAIASKESNDPVSRIHALWALEGIRHYDAALLSELLKANSSDVRREAIRSLNSFGLSAADIAAATEKLIDDANPAVRSQVIRTLDEAGAGDPRSVAILVKAARPELPGNQMGGSYERRFERYLVRKALERSPGTLLQYVNAPAAQEAPAVNMLWAVQALPAAERDKAFLQFWPKAKLSALDESTFVSMAAMLPNPDIYQAMKQMLNDPAQARTYLGFAVQNQSQVQSSALSELLAVPVNTLLQSTETADRNLALDVAGRYRIAGARDAAAALVTDHTPDATLKLALKVLETVPSKSEPLFLKMVTNENLSFDIRAAALGSLVKANPAKARQAATQWLSALNEQEKNDLADVLSASVQGSGLLLTMYDKKLLPLSAFDLSAAERIAGATKNDARSTAIVNGVKKREETKRKEFKGKLTKYMTIAEKHGGNAEAGKVLFQTCLACHQVGSQGQSIAPALDGSANRENESLLTAILNPDAAIESGYAVYRVTRKDGSQMEGYLVNKDNQGTTLAFMGGGKSFIEAGAIKSQGFLGGRSFMVKGLIDNYSDQQVADLLSYIRTLK
ncbi:putative heme-binding domain-containing protein [Dyadobacter soli]|uniref:Putative heme-binding domain-containing protein n=1 Tax=Dyadobacter soli TaxID=659014 RepID=A0A1G7GFX5_9BACT|nr:HEAT repeat domain-containing protein [Dyadobacter soli]SDE87001.1 putative heme-binding domain-containing protein [Dyadobacter soli]